MNALLAIVVSAVIGLIGGTIYFYSTHECVVSHEEIQYEAPPVMNVGGGKKGGGIGIPMGNMKPVNVTICDEYKKK